MDLFNPEAASMPTDAAIVLVELPDDTAIVPATSPTKTPTATPTEAPMKAPTKSPSLKPTLEPTRRPTTSPTETPSVSRAPTVPPSAPPSSSSSPSVRQSERPSASLSPSATPSDSASPTSEGQHTGLQVTLVGVRAVEDLSDWEEATARYYQGVYNGDDDNDGDYYDGGGGPSVLEDAVVRIRLTKQNTIDTGGRRAERWPSWGTRDRTLQEAPATSVVVTYTQSTTYRGRDPGLGDAEMLRLPLSTEEYRDSYVAGLKGDLEGYEDLVGVSGVSTPYNGNGIDGATDGTNDAGGPSTALVVGVACGGAAFLLLVGGLAYYRRARKKNDEEDDGPRARKRSEGDGRQGVAGRVVEDEPEKPLGDMSVASDWFPLDEGLDAAEELRTVYAPAGKLGLIIDSPDGGAPVIHDVKGTSPIAEEVRAGDRLVAVDEEDVRAMTAVKVSRLISKKSASSRKLVVVRQVYS